MAGQPLHSSFSQDTFHAVKWFVLMQAPAARLVIQCRTARFIKRNNPYINTSTDTIAGQMQSGLMKHQSSWYNMAGACSINQNHVRWTGRRFDKAVHSESNELADLTVFTNYHQLPHPSHFKLAPSRSVSAEIVQQAVQNWPTQSHAHILQCWP